MSQADLLSQRLRNAWGAAEPAVWRELTDAARLAKEGANDPGELNRLWAVENLAAGLAEYVAAYRHLAEGRFYEGWCALEQAELAMLWASQNTFMPEFAKLIAWLEKRVGLWQSLFPYKLFFSPGMRVKDWRCSICGRRSTPVSPCGHTPGKVYAGQFCSRVVTKADVLEISIVMDPVQKYSVCFLEDHEHDYTLLEFVLERLSGPFHHWRGEWTYRRHPHHLFADHSADGPCPCESSLRYSECCAPTEGVRVRHFAMEAAGEQEAVEDLKLIKLRPRAGAEVVKEETPAA